MQQLEKVSYIATYNGNSYEIECWKGTPIAKVWNSQKYWYLPGSIVSITDDKGNSKTFMKGMC